MATTNNNNSALAMPLEPYRDNPVAPPPPLRAPTLSAGVPQQPPSRHHAAPTTQSPYGAPHPSVAPLQPQAVAPPPYADQKPPPPPPMARAPYSDQPSQENNGTVAVPGAAAARRDSFADVVGGPPVSHSAPPPTADYFESSSSSLSMTNDVYLGHGGSGNNGHRSSLKITSRPPKPGIKSRRRRILLGFSVIMFVTGVSLMISASRQKKRHFEQCQAPPSMALKSAGVGAGGLGGGGTLPTRPVAPPKRDRVPEPAPTPAPVASEEPEQQQEDSTELPDDVDRFNWIESDDTTKKGFGHLVAISRDGHRIAVARQGETGGVGNVYVYSRNGNGTLSWNLERKLTPAPGNYAHRGPEHQGMAMNANGDRIAFTQADKVQVYYLKESNDYRHPTEWKRMGIPLDAGTGEQGKAYDHFGTRLAFSDDGKLLAVQSDSSETGFVRLFKSRDEIDWKGDTSSQDIWDKIGEDITGDRLGGDIDLSADGSRVAIGTVASKLLSGPAKGDWAGLVRVFEFNFNGWEEVGQDIPGAGGGEHFGGAVSLSDSGDVLAVGSRDGDAGYVHCFKLTAFGVHQGGWEWEPHGQVLYGESPLERYGASVRLSGDGKVLVVGAPGSPELAHQHEEVRPEEDRYKYGRIIIYEYSETTSRWEQVGDTMFGFGGMAGDAFGKSVAISKDGKKLVAGAPLRTVNEVPGVGGVFAYEFV